MDEYISYQLNKAVKLRTDIEGTNIKDPETIPQRFKKTVEKYSTKPALHLKKGEEWIVYTFQQYYDESIKFSKALISLGFKKHDVINIIGFNSPEWHFSDIGAILAGGVAAGIYSTNNPASCKYIAEHSDAIVVVCEGAKQLEKFFSISSSLPKLKALVVYNIETIPNNDCNVPVYKFSDFLQTGKNITDEEVTARMEDQKPGEACTLIYTSGTTGNPKAVMLSHDNILWTTKCVVNDVGSCSGVEIDNNDKMVSYLPLSHIAAQLLDIHATMCTGLQVFFAQPDALRGSLATTLKEVSPTIFMGVPRVWEKIMEKMQAASERTQGLKKRIAIWATSKGTEKTTLEQYKNSGGAPCGFGCANTLVLSKVRAALGLSHCRVCITSAAPIHREVLDFFGKFSIPIYELYGQSECTGPETYNMMSKWKIGTVGKAMPGTKLEIVSGTTEIIYSGRNIMMGYLKNEVATKEVIDERGYLHSGDCGKIDEDGFISIIGRIKELIITAGGENIGPVAIEDSIKENTKGLSNVMVIGDKRKFLTALYTICVIMSEDGIPTDKLNTDARNVSKEIGSTAETVGQVKQCEKWAEYLHTCLDKANKNATSRACCVQKFSILDNDFTIATGELTPTLKLRRSVVAAKYEKVINSMYDESQAPKKSDNTKNPESTTGSNKSPSKSPNASKKKSASPTKNN